MAEFLQQRLLSLKVLAVLALSGLVLSFIGTSLSTAEGARLVRDNGRTYVLSDSDFDDDDDDRYGRIRVLSDRDFDDDDDRYRRIRVLSDRDFDDDRFFRCRRDCDDDFVLSDEDFDDFFDGGDVDQDADVESNADTDVDIDVDADSNSDVNVEQDAD